MFRVDVNDASTNITHCYTKDYNIVIVKEIVKTSLCIYNYESETIKSPYHKSKAENNIL